MQLDVPRARLARPVPRFRGWHRLLEPLRRMFVQVYEDRPERWIVIDDFERDLRMRLDRSAYMSSLIHWRVIHSFSEASLLRDAPVVQFPTTSMDAFVVSKGLPCVDVIKIGVEGAEKALLAGAQATLRRFRPKLILELNAGTFSSAGYAGAKCVASLRELGYALFDMDLFGRITPLGERGPAEFGTLFARHEVLG